MERLILLITLLLGLSLNAFAINQGPLLIKVKRAVVYGQDISTDFSGDLESFVNSDFFGPEYSEGELEFSLGDEKSYFNNAKNVARYAWKFITDNATIKAPYPCGLYLKGKIIEKSIKDDNNIITQYAIKGNGDGSLDSCTGNGGPGWWSYQVIVEYNPTTESGSIKYILEEE